MQTQASPIPRTTATAKPVVQAKNRVPAITPPTLLPVSKQDTLQRKTDNPFAWMNDNTVVQQKTTGKALQPSRQAIVQPKTKAPVVQLKKAIQPKVEVGRPNDHYEQEADRIAEQVVNMPDQTPQPSHQPTAKVQTATVGHISPLVASPLQAKIIPINTPVIQRQTATNTAPHTVPADVESRLNSSSGRGSPMDEKTKSYFEPRFGADFGSVKIHNDGNAARLNNHLGSAAFAYGTDVYFNQNQYNPASKGGKQLIAHELTHVLQQGHALRRKTFAVSIAPRSIQRFGTSDALDVFADKANMIPGFRMFTIVAGFNPINMTAVDKSPANILRALIEFMPGGGLVTQALDNSGIFEKVANWAMQQVSSLGIAGSAIRQSLLGFIGSLGIADALSPGDVWERAKTIFTGPINQIISFARGMVTGIVAFVKEAILLPIARMAEGTAGYDLLKGVLGKDPITGEPVINGADVLIGGFMKLIGQEEIWQNMKKANAVARAWSWFQGALNGLRGFVQHIPALAIAAFKSLELVDIILIPRAFMKIAGVFGSFMGNFVSWAGNAVWNLLEIIFEAVSPGALVYIKKTGAALKSILMNPMPFVGNLVKAAKLGFLNFAGNIGTHLKTGLIEWLTGALPGVYIPKSFTIGEMVRFVFSVLGITWQNVRQKLVKVVGEPAVKAMETGFDIVVTLVTQGPAAAWDKIKDQLSGLKDMVVGGITDFVVSSVVQKAVPKLISMFIPGAGFISAILSIYDTVMVFVNKISKIIQVVTGFIDSIVAIAGGAIGAAAARVENTMAGLLSLAINFLAGFVGLGKVSDKVMGVIQKVRTPIDKALDALIAWIVTMAKKLFSKVFGKKDEKDERTDEQKLADVKKAVKEGTQIASDKSVSKKKKIKGLDQIKKTYKLTKINLVSDQEDKTKETVHVHAEINPTYDGDGIVLSKFPPEPTVVIEATVGAPLPVRPGNEKVLQSPGKAGLPGYQRAHLMGPGLGKDAPQGIFYAPRDVNLKLQNSGIEHMIRAMYAQRYPNAEFRVTLTADPHSGTEILAKANYKLYGRFSGEPWAFIFEYTIKVGLGAAAAVKVLAGDADMDAVHRFSAGAAAVIKTRST